MGFEGYSEENILLLQYGRQDCKDMHSWGPGMRQCYIIHYIMKGAGYIKIKDRCWRAEAGQSFIIYPLTIVQYFPDEARPWEYVWIDFTGKDVPEYLKYIGFEPKRPVYPVITNDRLLPLFERLENMDIYNKNKMEANGILQAILGIYADECPVIKNSLQAGEDNRFSMALGLIHANYYKCTFNVEKLCGLMNINRVTLYRLFRNKMDSSPNGYILRHRLKQAKLMLDMGVSVKNASVSCGFADQFYFSKVFKKYFGISPMMYKKGDNILRTL